LSEIEANLRLKTVNISVWEHKMASLQNKKNFGRRATIPMPQNNVLDSIVPTAPLNTRRFLKKIFSRKSGLAIVAATTIFGAFGALVVKAGDDSGVYEFIKSQSKSGHATQRAATLPPIFVPSSQYDSRQSSNRQAIGYARSNDYDYAPRKMGGDYMRNDYHPRSLKADNSKAKLSSKSDKNNFDAIASGRDSQPVAYCVRLCDGFYFPVGTGNDNFDKHESACNSVCPSAQTRVYVAPTGSDDIGKASHRGQTYAKLSSAFSYRQQRTKTCSCNSASSTGGLGMFSPSPENDTTLNHGDVVMTDAGFKAFAGGTNFPHRGTEFVPATWMKSLTAGERDKLINMANGGRRSLTTEKRSRKQKVAEQKLIAVKTANYQPNSLISVDYAPIEASKSKFIRNVAPFLSGAITPR
jgi:Protein of unknown function (DUF2865)